MLDPVTCAECDEPATLGDTVCGSHGVVDILLEKFNHAGTQPVSGEDHDTHAYRRDLPESGARASSARTGSGRQRALLTRFANAVRVLDGGEGGQVDDGVSRFPLFRGPSSRRDAIAIQLIPTGVDPLPLDQLDSAAGPAGRMSRRTSRAAAASRAPV